MIVVVGKELRIVCSGVLFLPNDIGNEIVFSENFVRNLTKMVHFRVINCHEQESVMAQQRARQFQSRIHHVQPVRVKPTGGFGVRAELVAVAIDLPCEF